jgi:flavin-dependent dehydrogenase
MDDHILDNVSFSDSFCAEHLSQSRWDTVVIGAGVAGTSFAIRAARQHRNVLLVDSAPFPRDKVCGGCLNARAQRELSELGLLEDLHRRGAVTIGTMKIRIGRQDVSWRIADMLSVRRSTLDAMLAHKAIKHGASFYHSVRASLIPCLPPSSEGTRKVLLKHEKTNESVVVSADFVVVAAGLSRSPLPREESWSCHTEADSRIGVHCLISRDSLSSLDMELGCDDRQTLLMCVGEHGYVGICETDGNRIDIAAAIDPKAIRRVGSISKVVAQIVRPQSHRLAQCLEQQTWHATPKLTRFSFDLARNRVFLLGDATGYVEPFTGEGMSWAMLAAKKLWEITQSIQTLEPSDCQERDWNLWNQQQCKTKRSVSRWVSRRARNTQSAKWVITALDWFPAFRNRIIMKATQ